LSRGRTESRLRDPGKIGRGMGTHLSIKPARDDRGLVSLDFGYFCRLRIEGLRVARGRPSLQLSRFLSLANTTPFPGTRRFRLGLLRASATQRYLFLFGFFPGDGLAAIAARGFFPAASLFMLAFAWNRLVARPTTRRLCIRFGTRFCRHVPSYVRWMRCTRASAACLSMHGGRSMF
jgi:hypothetical protein